MHFYRWKFAEMNEMYGNDSLELGVQVTSNKTINP